MVLTSTKLWEECDEKHTRVTYYSSLKNFFSSLKEKANLAIIRWKSRIGNWESRLDTWVDSQYSTHTRIEYQIVNLLLNCQYFTFIVKRCMMPSQMQFHRLRLLFSHILGMQREIAVFIHLAHFCRFEVKPITPRNFWKPLEKHYCLVSKYYWKTPGIFQLLLGEWTLN